MVPFSPRTTMPEPIVSAVLPSMPSARLLAPVLPSTMVPVPPSVWSPMNDSTLLRLTLIVPLSVSPPVTRSIPVPLAMSSRPLSVTPVRLFELLLNATQAPLPVVLMMPPVIALPNWLTTLPLAMLITPPVLLMLWPAETPRFAVMALPTLMVPVFAVLPPPARFSPNWSMLIAPPLASVRIDWPESMVTVFAPAMVALSEAPGTTRQDHNAATPQLPVAGPQVQAAAIACGLTVPPNAAATAAASARVRIFVFSVVIGRSG